MSQSIKLASNVRYRISQPTTYQFSYKSSTTLLLLNLYFFLNRLAHFWLCYVNTCHLVIEALWSTKLSVLFSNFKAQKIGYFVSVKIYVHSSDFGLNRGDTLGNLYSCSSASGPLTFSRTASNQTVTSRKHGLVCISVRHGTLFFVSIWLIVKIDKTCCRHGYLERALMPRIRSGRLPELSFIDFSLLPSHWYQLEKIAHMASTLHCKCHMASKGCEHVR